MRGFEIKFEKSKVQCGHVGLWLAQLSNKLSVKRPHYINKSFHENVNIKRSSKLCSIPKTFQKYTFWYKTAFSSFRGLMYEMHVALNNHRRATDIGEQSLFKCFVWRPNQVETDVPHFWPIKKWYMVASNKVQQRPTVPICFTLPCCALCCVNVDIFFKQKMWHHCQPSECFVYFKMTGLKERSIYSLVQHI